MNTRHIVFLAIPGATLLDITGPYEVFTQAIELNMEEDKKPPYILHIISSERSKTIRTASGFTIQCESTIMNINYKIDTLFVPGVPNSIQTEYRLNKNALQWIRQQANIVRRICSVCTGTFFLAETGILDGKTATTHWAMCQKLLHNYPSVKVENDPIFIKDENIYTSAGISSGMDLALTLIEEDFGRSKALEVAKQMVLYLKRPGTQSQYSSALIFQSSDYRPVQDIQNWILEHLKDQLTVEQLAEKVSMSPRNFARVFVKETGITPAKYIDKLRIETACHYLIESQLTLKEIADICGLGTPDNMRRVFMKHLHITPSDYKRNFGTSMNKPV